ncbi:type IV pilus modification PilV family protein [Microbacterium aureliae]
MSLVEVVIAMMLLGIIAMTILPALWQGIQLASEQSSAATATRFLNSLVEEARELEDCTTIPSVIGRTATDGKGASMTSTGSLSGCASGVAATLNLSIVQNGDTLASTTARIFIP